jgi:DHA1 family bicyclomycin/chloramphenicol resistance-like MFS transporter
MSDAVMTQPLMSPARTAAIGGLLTALGSVSMALYTPAMPTLVTAFGTEMSFIKLSLVMYFAGFALAQLVCGPMSDAYGRRPIAFLFLTLYTVGGLGAFLAPSVNVLIAARLVQGIGAAVGVSVSRAIVRDLFTGLESARILNLIGIVLSVGPAISPTLGGVVLELAGWRSVFLVMVLVGLGALAVVWSVLPETNHTPDRALRDPRRVAVTYAGLAIDRQFIGPAIGLGFSVGALYMLGTLLPFVLIDRVGMTPTHFGMGMLAQTGSYFTGGLVARVLMAHLGAERLVTPGLALALAGAAATLLLDHPVVPAWATVMLPVAIFAFSIALVIPALTTAALAPFPTTAGSASALLGFVQMGSGFVGGILATLFADPVEGMRVMFPAMLAIALGARLFLSPGR